MLRRALFATPALLLAAPARALDLPAEASQGGLLLGQGAQGLRLSLEGRAIRVAPGGEFILGFGRDHGPEAVLAITDAHGRASQRRIAVRPREWDVQRIQGLPSAQVSPDPAAMARITAERQRLAAARATDSARTGFLAGLGWPARGRISGVYGSQRILNGEPRAPHFGLDIAGPVGTPIHAAMPGRVMLAGDFFFFGKLLVIDHGHGLHTLYAHLSAQHVSEGADVAKGQHIAAMGATGRVTGPHLHFSLGWYGIWLDPQPLLGA